MIDTTEMCSNNNTIFSSNDTIDVDIDIVVVGIDSSKSYEPVNDDNELDTIRTTIQIFLQQERNIYYNTSSSFNNINNNYNWIQELSTLTNKAYSNKNNTTTNSESTTTTSTTTISTTSTKAATIDIDWFHCRTVMIQWLNDIVSYWDMINSTSTIEITINYIDRCMMSIVQKLRQQKENQQSQKEDQQQKNDNNPLLVSNILNNFTIDTFQLVCILCFYIACKLNEPICLNIDTIYTLLKYKYTIQHMKDIEQIIVQSLLHWYVHPPTTESYIYYYLQYIKQQQKQHQQQHEQQHCYIDYDTIKQTATHICSTIIQKSNYQFIIGGNTIKPSILAYCAIVHTVEQYNNSSISVVSSNNIVKDLLLSLLSMDDNNNTCSCSCYNATNEKQIIYMRDIDTVQYHVTSFLMIYNTKNTSSLIIVDAEVINDNDDDNDYDIIIVNEIEIMNENDSNNKNNDLDDISSTTTTKISTVAIQLLQQHQQEQQQQPEVVIIEQLQQNCSPRCTIVSDIYIHNNNTSNQQQLLNNNNNEKEQQYYYCTVHDNDSKILVVLGELIIDED